MLPLNLVLSSLIITSHALRITIPGPTLPVADDDNSANCRVDVDGRQYDLCSLLRASGFGDRRGLVSSVESDSERESFMIEYPDEQSNDSNHLFTRIIFECDPNAHEPSTPTTSTTPQTLIWRTQQACSSSSSSHPISHESNYASQSAAEEASSDGQQQQQENDGENGKTEEESLAPQVPISDRPRRLTRLGIFFSLIILLAFGSLAYTSLLPKTRQMYNRYGKGYLPSFSSSSSPFRVGERRLTQWAEEDFDLGVIGIRSGAGSAGGGSGAGTSTSASASTGGGVGGAYNRGEDDVMVNGGTGIGDLEEFDDVLESGEILPLSPSSRSTRSWKSRFGVGIGAGRGGRWSSHHHKWYGSLGSLSRGPSSTTAGSS